MSRNLTSVAGSLTSSDARCILPLLAQILWISFLSGMILNRPKPQPYPRPARSIRQAVLAFVIVTSCVRDVSGQLHTDAMVRGETAPEAQGIIDLQRLRGPVTLDGIPEEAAWEGIDVFPLTMYQPTFRGSSDREVAIRVAYDDEALYVAGLIYEADASDISTFSLTRDRYGGDDGFSVILDTFNDNENAVRFTGLPLGTRIDHSISNDGQTPGPGNVSWNTFWDLETQIGEDGWSGEMRIPFSSLRFKPESDGSVVMGLMAFTYQAGRDSRWTFPAMSRSAPYTKPSAFQDVRLRGIVPQKPVYITPYALAATARTHELSTVGDRFVRIEDRAMDFGGDLKFTPTPNLTLDLTVNTDFAAVESDQQQVNLTRFSLFFEEKRPFFQERAGIFSFDTGADKGTLFYSRRIGLSDGQPVPILGGVRLVGRVGEWDLGFIEMQTAADGDFNSENFGVVRLRRRVLNANSFTGAMATSRVGPDGAYNVTYGIDGLFRLVGDEYLTMKWLQTLQGGDAATDLAPTGLEAGRIFLDWTRRRISGFSYQLGYTWSGPGYNPGVGFEPRTDFSRGQTDLNYSWFPDASSHSRFRRIWLGSQNNIWVLNQNHGVETGRIQPFLQFETKLGVIWKLSTTTQYENVETGFALGDGVDIPAGRYWATVGALEMRAARAWPIRPNVTVTAGDFFDGSRFGVSTDVTWPTGPYLEVVGGVEWNQIHFDERNEAFDSRLLRLTLRGAVNTNISIDAFAQYSSLTDQLTTNTRFRYNFREGQDFWVVWNEGLNTDRDVLGSPRLPFENASTLTVKYSHTWIS